MVLQEPINQPNSREFVLRKTNVREFKTLEDRVKQLFGAEFEVFIPLNETSSVKHDCDDASIEWIRVISEEHPELLDGAKVLYLVILFMYILIYVQRHQVY